MGHSRYIELILFKTYFDLRAEASKTYLNIIWWILEPLLYMGVFYVVFGLLFQRGGGPEYVPFLLTGLTVWKWFDSTIRSGSNAVAANANLMQQVYIPKVVFPTIVVLQNTVKFFFVFVLLLMFLWIFGVPLSVSYLSLPVLFMVQLALITGFTYMVSSVVPFVPDLGHIIANGLVLLMFVSGIFFSGHNIPEQYRFYFYLNPMATVIESYRDVLLAGQWPDWGALYGPSLLAGVAIGIGVWIFRRYDRVYPKLA